MYHCRDTAHRLHQRDDHGIACLNEIDEAMRDGLELVSNLPPSVYEVMGQPTTLDAVERQMDVLRDAIRHYN